MCPTAGFIELLYLSSTSRQDLVATNLESETCLKEPSVILGAKGQTGHWPFCSLAFVKPCEACFRTVNTSLCFAHAPQHKASIGISIIFKSCGRCPGSKSSSVSDSLLRDWNEENVDNRWLRISPPPKNSTRQVIGLREWHQSSVKSEMKTEKDTWVGKEPCGSDIPLVLRWCAQGLEMSRFTNRSNRTVRSHDCVTPLMYIHWTDASILLSNSRRVNQMLIRV